MFVKMQKVIHPFFSEKVYLIYFLKKSCLFSWSKHIVKFSSKTCLYFSCYRNCTDRDLFKRIFRYRNISQICNFMFMRSKRKRKRVFWRYREKMFWNERTELERRLHCKLNSWLKLSLYQSCWYAHSILFPIIQLKFGMR